MICVYGTLTEGDNGHAHETARVLPLFAAELTPVSVLQIGKIRGNSVSTNREESELYYRLPVNLEFVAKSYRDESHDFLYFIDLLTGGVFSLRAMDGDLEHASEGFDHEINYAFQHTPERFLCICEFTPSEKKQIIGEFAASLRDQALGERLREASFDDKPFAAAEEALISKPAEFCYWREHLEKASIIAAAEFLKCNDIMTEPLKSLDPSSVLKSVSFVN